MESSAARPPADEALGSDLGRRMEARRPLPAWALSLVTHLTLGVLLGLTVRAAAPRGAAVEPDRTGGIVLVQKHRGQRDYFQDPGDAPKNVESDTPDAAPQSPAEALPAAESPPSELAGVLPAGEELLAAGTALSDALPGADGFTTGAARAQDFGGGVQTSVFGVQGQGSKFVYVFDRSSSMTGFEGRPLAAAKRELLASLRDLRDVHQFQIIFYNDRMTICNVAPGRPPRLLYGSDRDRGAAARFIESISGAGGTRHLEPLLAALRMGPDVIFFLTDAGEPTLSAAELAKIRQVNRRHGVSIHTIEFGVGPSTGESNFLTELARQNHGQHVYVDVSRLPATR